MTDDPNAPPAPARSADVFCTLKVPGELHAAFANVARARSRTIEWMVLEFMRASIGRWSPAQYKNEDDEPLIIAARRAFAAWRRYPNPQFLATVTLGGVLAKLRERAERTAGTGLGRPFAVAMNDLLERSGLVAIDKRARSCLVNCSEHRGAITKWIGKIPHKQRPVDPRQIWRRYQAQQRKSPPDASNDEAPLASSEKVPGQPDHPVEGPVAPIATLEPVKPEALAVKIAGRHIIVDPAGGTFAAWVAERCRFGEGLRAWISELHGDYVEWMRRTHEYAMPLRIFATALAAREFDRIEQRDRMFIGVGLKAGYAQLEKWLDERCERGPRLYQSSHDLWLDFREWAEARGGIAPAEWLFISRLAGVEGLHRSRKLPDGLRGFCGIALKDNVAAQLVYDQTGSVKRAKGYRLGDEYGPLAYALMIEGLREFDLAAETGMVLSIATARRVMRKPANSVPFEQWCRSTMRQIFEQILTGNDARQIAQGLTVPDGWPLVPERVVERIRDRLAAAPDHSALRRFREEVLKTPALGGGPVDERASEIDQETSTPEAEIIEYPRRSVRRTAKRR